MARKSILVTGGTGYIGSFTVLALLEAGFPVIVVDSLYNSSIETLNRINLLHPPTPALPAPTFHKIDITHLPSLDAVFAQHKDDILAVIHFAALKSVGESTENPLEYYRVNVGGTVNLLQCMQKYMGNEGKVVFSSSATVYGDATRFENMIPIPEECPTGPTNPYGRTKLVVEMVIEDHVTSHPGWSGALLRYFNPAGAHPTGLMGEDPQGTPYNLLPLLGQVAVGRREKLHVYGTDYASHDGTAIRDYIHILDLASGHVSAVKHLLTHPDIGCRAWNLGTGKGSTVFDIITAFGKAVGRELPYETHPRRKGDVLDLTAVPRRANSELGWRAERGLDETCQDLWRWVRENPWGYRQPPKSELLEELWAKQEKAGVTPFREGEEVARRHADVDFEGKKLVK
ncbi:hypothetical protein DFH27DRAFT_642614 [Peziza echinospora]|nr:hypothetical protein DFH27DRAFT_642614 [Peziza echinospora]